MDARKGKMLWWKALLILATFFCVLGFLAGGNVFRRETQVAGKMRFPPIILTVPQSNAVVVWDANDKFKSLGTLERAVLVSEEEYKREAEDFVEIKYRMLNGCVKRGDLVVPSSSTSTWKDYVAALNKHLTVSDTGADYSNISYSESGGSVDLKLTLRNGRTEYWGYQIQSERIIRLTYDRRSGL